jgi:hypothetical protein
MSRRYGGIVSTGDDGRFPALRVDEERKAYDPFWKKN